MVNPLCCDAHRYNQSQQILLRLETHVGEILQPWHLLVLALIFLPIFTVITVVPYWMIFKKAGFAPSLSFLMIVPMLNLIVLFVVAFAEWKVVPAPQPVWQPPAPYPPPPVAPTA